MADINAEPAQIDQGSAVVATTYVFIIFTLLTVVLRLTVSFIRRRRFGLDDALLIVAMVFGLLSAICTGNAVMNGLGRSIATVHSGQLARYFKLSYSSTIFAILALAASKLSVVALVERLMPYNSPSVRYIRMMYPVLGCWMLFSVFGVAFECSLPAPWIYQPSRCAGHAIWYPIAVSCILTDIILALGFVPVVKDTQMDSTRKFKVTGLFLSRLIVSVLAIAHIAVLAPAQSSEDQTQAMTNPSILGQVLMSLSILTAAIPILSRGVMSLEPVSPAAVVAEITAVNLDTTHSRANSDENNRLRDWAFAQLRNSPTPNSLIMINDIANENEKSPRKPEKAHMGLERVDTAPPIPPRSDRRSPSPRLTLNFGRDSTNLDVKEAWFIDSKRTSSMTEDTIDELKRHNH